MKKCILLILIVFSLSVSFIFSQAKLKQITWKIKIKKKSGNTKPQF